MSGNVLVVLDKQSKVGAGSTIAMNGDSIGGFSVSVSGAGNVSARVRLEIANDPGGPWVSDAASIVSLSGICSATTYLRSTTHFEYIRAVVESISAGASVSVFFGDFASSGTGFYQQDNLVFGEINPLTGEIAFSAGGQAIEIAAPRVLFDSAVAVALTGTLTKTALATVDVPAGVMGPNSTLRVLPVWSYTNSANNKVIGVEVGTAMPGTTIYMRTRTTTAGEMPLIEVKNRGVKSSQINKYSSGSSYSTAQAAAPSTHTIDFNQATKVFVYGTLANVGETITLESLLVEVLNPYK